MLVVLKATPPKNFIGWLSIMNAKPGLSRAELLWSVESRLDTNNSRLYSPGENLAQYICTRLQSTAIIVEVLYCKSNA